MSSAVPFPLASIKLHTDLQVRGGTDFNTVRRYALAMREGARFPAITLAEIGANLYIIDGHHRFNAAHQAGEVTIMANKRRMSLNEATREAYASNRDHGRNLSQKEKQHAFTRYIELGMHLDEWGMVKPLRQIAHECPVYAFQTIGRKLTEQGISAPRGDVKPYRYGYDCADNEPSDDDLALDQVSLLATFEEHLASAMASYARLDGKCRGDALGKLRSLVRGLDGSPTHPAMPLEI